INVGGYRNPSVHRVLRFKSMAEDDLDRDDEYLDDEDEDEEDDDDLSPQSRRPPVRPFGTTGPAGTSGSSSFGSSSRLPGSGSRDSSQLPGSRPAGTTGSSYQSRYGTS